MGSRSAGWLGVRLFWPRTSCLTPLPQDFVEICKREGDPEEKGVDRLLGLGSARLGQLGSRGQDWAVIANCPQMLCPLQWLCGPRGAVPRRQRGCQTWAVSVHGKPCQLQCIGSWGLEVSEVWGRTPWASLTTATLLIQHHRVDSEGPSTAPSATRKKPRAEDKAELE